MKILFLNRWVGVHSGGTETHVKELALFLAKRGHEVHILTREGNELADMTGIRIWRVPKTPLESDFSYEDWRVYLYTMLFVIQAFIRLLLLKLKGVEFDVVSVHFATEAFLMRFARAVFGWPYVFVLEGYTTAEGREAKMADMQISISDDISRDCQREFGYSPIVIPKGLNSERFNRSVDDNGIRSRFCGINEDLVLTVCRLEPRKDIPTLVAAAELVHKQNPKVKFVIVGDGISRSQIAKQIRSMRLEATVILAGDVSYFDDNLPRFYAAADVFALPTLYEGFGYVFVEAMASGIPIVSTKAPAVPEVVGDAGFLVQPGSPELFAAAILRVISDPELRAKLIQRGIEKASRYSWPALIVRYEYAYAMATTKFRSKEPAFNAANLSEMSKSQDSRKTSRPSRHSRRPWTS